MKFEDVPQEVKDAIIKEHHRKIAIKGGRANVEKNGLEHMRRISKIASDVRWAKHRAEKAVNK